jgi:hypothetical protein
MPNLKVEMDETEYRLCVNEVYGPVVSYGMPGIVAAGQEIYYCLIEDPDTDTVIVNRVDSISQFRAELEDVEFTKDEEEPDEPEEADEPDETDEPDEDEVDVVE